MSSLSLGEHGWTQVANFTVTGMLTVGFAVGAWQVHRPLGGSRWGPLLIAISGVGLAGAGIFMADPLSGYPPGTPGMPLQPSGHGTLHRLLSALYFLGLPAACLVFARRFARSGARRWAIYSALSAGGFWGAFVLAAVAFAQIEPVVNFGGLFQRLALVIGEAWLTLLAIDLRRSQPVYA